MRILIHFILFSIILLNSANSQIKFQKSFGGTENEKFNSIISTSDGGYIIAGKHSNISQSDSNIIITRLNKYGNIIWSKKYYYNNYENCVGMCQLNNNEFVVAGTMKNLGTGRDFYIMCINSDGGIKWSKSIGDVNEEVCYQMIKISGGILLIGTKGIPSIDYTNIPVIRSAFVVKLNYAGDVIYSKLYTGGGIIFSGTKFSADGGSWIGYSPPETAVRFTAGTEDKDGNYLIAGCSLFAGDSVTTDGSGQHFYFIKTDSSGNIIWSKFTHSGYTAYYGYAPINSIQHDGKGHYFFCGTNYMNYDFPVYYISGTRNGCNGRMTIGSFDDDGNMRWFRQLSKAGTMLNKLTIAQNRDIVCAGYYLNYGAFMMRADTLGRLKWSRVFGTGSGRESFNDIEQSTTSFLLAGYDILNNNNGYIVSTDTTGMSAGCNQIALNDTFAFQTARSSYTFPMSVSNYGNVNSANFLTTNNNQPLNTLCINIPPEPPVITPEVSNVLIFKNCPYKLYFQINDINLPGDTLSPVKVLAGHGPTRGSLTRNSDTSFTYYPSLNFTGKDSIWVYVNDSTGLKDTARIYINIIQQNITLGKDTTLCNYARLVLNAGTGFDSYQWQDGSTGQTYTIEVPGTYWVKVTSGLCSARDTINVTYNYYTEVTLGNDTTMCEGNSLSLNAHSGYTSYNWQDGSTDSTFTINSEGLHWVKVTSGICGMSDSVYVRYDTIPDINLGNDTILCNDATVTLYPGNGFDSYLWQDGSHDSIFQITEADTCWVRIAAGACITSDTIKVTYSFIKPIHLGNDTTLCEGDSITLNACAGYDSYLWQNSSTDSTLDVENDGIYSVHAKSGVCSINDTIIVSYDTIPDINLGNDTILCNNATVTLKPGSGFDSYLWHDGSTDTAFTVVFPDTCHVKIKAGVCFAYDTIKITYSYIIPVHLGNDTSLCEGDTLSMNAGSGYDTYLWQDASADSTMDAGNTGSYHVKTRLGVCYSLDTINIIFDTVPVIDLGNDTILCNNASITLNPGSGYDEYTWQDGSHNASFKATMPDTCCVNIRAGACLASDTIKITYSFIKPLYLGNDTSLCEGDSMMLNAGKGYDSYLWQDNSTDSTVEVTGNGTYRVKTTKGICILRDTINVNFDTIPDINLGKDTILCNDATITLCPGSGFDSYLWQDGSINSTFIVSEADTCRVRITSGACAASDTIEIEYSYIKPVSLGNDTSLCEGDSISFNTGSGYDSYQWQNGTTDSAITVDTTGTYWIKTTKGVCFSVDTIRVDYDTIPFINLGKDSVICYNDTIILSPGTGFDHYLWQDSSANTTYLVTKKGLYWTEITSGACSARDSINITDSTLKINLGKDTTLCEKTSITLTLGTGYTNYLWQDGSDLPTFLVNVTGTYWVIALKDCYAGKDSIVVSYYPPVPLPTIKYENDTLITLQGYSYKWYYENAIISNANSYLFFPEAEGLYTVEIADQNGCVNNDSLSVTGKGCDSIDVYPNPCDKYVYVNSHLLKINKITIMNPIGQLIRIYDKIPGNQFSISFENNLSNGIYFLIIETAECIVKKALFVAKFNE